MEQPQRYTLRKNERLCSRRVLDNLFNGKHVSFSAFPIRVVVATMEDEALQAPVTVLFSVSKRRFKRAVKRNRVKRQLREAYRRNKALLCSAQQPKRVAAFLWLSDRLYETERVETAMKTLLSKIAEHYAAPVNDGQP